MSPTTPRSNIVYFCDEASFLDEDFMGIAGIAINRSRIPQTLADLHSINESHRARGEIKWHNTRKRGLAVRKAYLDYLAGEIRQNRVHFHIRFSPMNEYDHDTERREFDTASKSFYQLLLHRPIRYYGKACQIHVRPDNGECTRLLPGLRDALHTDGWARYGSELDCIDSVVCLDSKREPMLQLLDVALGALTAYRNGRHLLETVSETKKELARYALPTLGMKSVMGNRDDGYKLSIWNVIPKKKKRGPRH